MYSKNWLIVGVLIFFVDYYNKIFNKDKDFIFVKMLYKEDYKIGSEFGFVKKVKENIELGNLKEVLNIILGF